MMRLPTAVWYLSAVVLCTWGTVAAQQKDSAVFRPGDAIRITAIPDTTFFVNTTYTIDGNGYVDLPIIGKKQIVNMTLEQFRSELDSAYIKYLRFPSIRVQPLMRLSLTGGFARPGLYHVDPAQPFWSAVQMAGGVVREDGVNKLVWERGHRIVSRDLIEVFESGNSMASAGFRSGDRVRVTARPRLTGWDVFRGDVLPVLSFTLGTVSTAATLYISYQTYQNRR